MQSSRPVRTCAGPYSPALLASFAKASTSGDATAARHAAHTLKGSSRSIGAFLFAEVCENAEKSARTGDLEVCQLLQNQITVAYDALKVDADEFLANAA